MITEELLNFLRAQYAAGMTAEEMEHLLMTEGGWNKEDVDEAFRQVGIVRAGDTPSQEPETPAVSSDAAPSDLPVAFAPDDFPFSVEAPSVEDAPPLSYAPGSETETPSVVEEPQVEATPLPSESLVAQDAPFAESVTPPVFTPATTEQTIPPSSVTETPQAEMVIAPDEDFLGIFSEEPIPPPEVTQVPPTEAPFVVVTPTAPLPPPLSPAPIIPAPAPSIPQVVLPPELVSTIVGAPDTTTPLPPPVAPSDSALRLDDVRAQATDIAEQIPGATVVPLPSLLTTPPSSPRSAGTQGSSTSSPAVPSTPVVGKEIKFDLSRISSRPMAAPAPAEAKSAESAPSALPTVKPVETRSVAEMWLAGANPEAKTPVPYASTTPRANINTRRTMNSDMLLRGKSGTGTVAAMPAISEEGLPTPVALPVAPAPEKTVALGSSVSTMASLPPTSSPVNYRKNQIKRIAPIILGVLAVCAMLFFAVQFILAHRGPSLDDRLTLTLEHFTALSSFSYAGEGFMDLTLTTSQGGITRDGKMKFVLKDSGTLKNSAAGFGDGVHRIKLSGGLQTGNFPWNTNVESDAHMVGNALFLHFLSYPSDTGFDPDVMQTYWIKIDLESIAKELALSGVSGSAQGYGSFGTGNAENTFNALYAKHLPFVADAVLPDETINGVPATHVTLKADPDHTLAFALALYKKYTGADLVLTADQQLRLKNALAKITGDIWVDATANTLLKISLRGDFDDDMVSAHVKGPVELVITFSDHNKPVAVAEPSPFLTLEEFRTRTDEYKKNKELRDADMVKADGIQKVMTALAAYYSEKGRYPTTLLDLRSAGKLPVGVVDDFSLKSYAYASYVKPDQLTKTGRCTAKGKACAFYHLGVSFQDMTNPMLATDADVNSEVLGKDSSGCAGEPNVYCFDVVSTAPAPTASTTAATTTSSR